MQVSVAIRQLAAAGLVLLLLGWCAYNRLAQGGRSALQQEAFVALEQQGLRWRDGRQVSGVREEAVCGHTTTGERFVYRDAGGLTLQRDFPAAEYWVAWCETGD